MTQLDVGSPRRLLSRFVWFALTVLVCVVVANTLWHARAERDARRATVRAELQRYDKVQREIDSNANVLDREFGNMEKAEALASTASTKRHDQAVSGQSTTQSNLRFAKQEQAAVGRAQDHLANVEERLDYFASTVATVLGDEAVRQYRSDAQAWTTSLRLHFTNWSRAVLLIVDDDMIAIRRGFDLSHDDADIERLYSAAGEADARASAQLRALSADAKEVRKKLAARISDAKNRFSNI